MSISHPVVTNAPLFLLYMHCKKYQPCYLNTTEKDRPYTYHLSASRTYIDLLLRFGKHKAVLGSI